MGLHEPNVIDLVTQNAATGEYALIMIQQQPWTDAAEQLAQLGEKINDYAMFALDEGLLRAYPQSADHPVRIQLDCTGVPTPRAKEYLDRATERLGEYGITFVVNLLT